MPDIQVLVDVIVEGRYQFSHVASASQGNPLFNASEIEAAMAKAGRQVLAAVAAVDGDIRDVPDVGPHRANENRFVTRSGR